MIATLSTVVKTSRFVAWSNWWSNFFFRIFIWYNLYYYKIIWSNSHWNYFQCSVRYSIIKDSSAGLGVIFRTLQKKPNCLSQLDFLKLQTNENWPLKSTGLKDFSNFSSPFWPMWNAEKSPFSFLILFFLVLCFMTSCYLLTISSTLYRLGQ